MFVTQLGFAAFAVYLAWRGNRKAKRDQDMEEFVTARSQIGMFRLGWSFFASE